MPFSASPLPITHPHLPALSSAPLHAFSASSASSSVPRHGLPYVLPHHHRPAPTFVPRIIRASNSTGNPAAGSASGPSSSWADVACSPPNSPRARRPSTGAPSSNPVSLRSPPWNSAHVPYANPHWRPHAAHPHAPVQPQSFPLPAYLDHSALRHLLQTEPSPQLHHQVQAPLSPTHIRLVTPASDSDEDRSPSPPVRRYTTTTPVPSSKDTTAGSCPILRLPTRWSEQDRHPYLSVSPDGRELHNNGTAAVDNVGLARANHPIPPACGIYYFEIDVLSKSQKSHVSIGFTTSENRLNKLPGWDKNSWGYHSDDGHSFAAEKTGMTYGPVFGGGDTVGAGIDFSQNRAFFTKNGTLIGYVFDNIGIPPTSLYPSVGLRYTGESIRANFGQQPFRFDIDEHVQGQRDAVWAEIQRGPINWSVLNHPSKTEADDEPALGEEDREPGMGVGEMGREAMGKLVLGYLIHHGYAKTAQAFEKQLVAATPTSPALPVPPPGVSMASIAPLDMPDSPMPDAEAEPSDITSFADPSLSEFLATTGSNSVLERRLTVLRSIQAGDLDGALEQTQAWFPDVLARDEGFVRLKMRCRKFVELVNGAAETKRHVETVRSGKERENEPAGAGVDVDGMDVDDGAMGSGGAEDGKSVAEAALRAAIAYGRGLRAEYKRDGRKEVQALLERTFGVVAYHFPMEAKGEIGRWAGREGREALATEVNVAILESQGYPARPALERMYRQAGATVLELGHLGVGAAVFADARRELLEA
ncbi:hypothetical protein OF83DRAFT_1168849 [Amylostereum chailletii]|nr:hypothetical protein OF83DRAFT_1168849 [Amylostereum chailletii]